MKEARETVYRSTHIKKRKRKKREATSKKGKRKLGPIKYNNKYCLLQAKSCHYKRKTLIQTAGRTVFRA